MIAIIRHDANMHHSTVCDHLLCQRSGMLTPKRSSCLECPRRHPAIYNRLTPACLVGEECTWSGRRCKRLMQSIPGFLQRLLPGYNPAECSSRTQLLAVSPKEPKCLVGTDCIQTAQHSKQRSSPQQSHKPLPRHATAEYSSCPPGSGVVVDCCSIAQFAIPANIILFACASTARQC